MTFAPRLAAAFAALSLAFAAPALAQQAQPQMSAEEVTDAQIDAFVVATLAVENVRAEYIPQIEAAESDEQKQAIIDEANARIVESIEATDGIGVDEYVVISQVAQQDQELGQKIVSRMEEAQE